MTMMNTMRVEWDSRVLKIVRGAYNVAIGQQLMQFLIYYSLQQDTGRKVLEFMGIVSSYPFDDIHLSIHSTQCSLLPVS